MADDDKAPPPDDEAPPPPPPDKSTWLVPWVPPVNYRKDLIAANNRVVELEPLEVANKKRGERETPEPPSCEPARCRADQIKAKFPGYSARRIAGLIRDEKKIPVPAFDQFRRFVQAHFAGKRTPVK